MRIERIVQYVLISAIVIWGVSAIGVRLGLSETLSDAIGISLSYVALYSFGRYLGKKEEKRNEH